MKSEILNYLKNNTLGSENAQTSFEIVQRLNIDDNGRTKEMFRKIIRDLIKEGYPIGSNNHGYYFINSLEELKRVVENLENRALKINDRKLEIIKNFNNI